ncbi:helix-turn-helix transcriptional regulator [Agrobacterium genomosp. 3]|uniref:helix-turn-helix domain-containing protein n=1 Tax=Agrobacterium tomkonis TaxID=1183410 RepID=UPI001CD8B87F|nr:helix-turn-helix transcriptional regulator [Agrobacterium tomkonis]MCA1878884.1 helix-turn-helix transcriptional regulator [Agrobacterium tumefaciens]MCA1894034.1 helix-turn-helix transcriptional regulator [Agrobacterium tomkonis]
MSVFMRMSAVGKRTLPSSANLNVASEAASREDLDKRIGAALLELRNDREIFRTQLASRLGMKETGVRRHETGKTKLSVSRLIELCEVLDANPIEILCPVAPHLFGRTDEGAVQMVAMIKILSRLNEEALTSIFKVIRHFEPNNSTIEN